MTFAVYLPPQAEKAAVPCLYWLSGLTCTDENFSQKAGGFRAAAARGLALVMPDTSPRGVTIEGADDSYDFGSGAGFGFLAGFVVYAIVDLVFGFRMSPEDEHRGADLSIHKIGANPEDEARMTRV